MRTKKRFALMVSVAVVWFATGPVAIAQNAESKAEQRQMVEDMSPRAQAQLARREAQAAYQDAVAECKKMRGNQRAACMKEARSNLQNDLAQGRQGSGKAQ
jgi:hypothetical protein